MSLNSLMILSFLVCLLIFWSHFISILCLLGETLTYEADALAKETVTEEKPPTSWAKRLRLRNLPPQAGLTEPLCYMWPRVSHPLPPQTCQCGFKSLEQQSHDSGIILGTCCLITVLKNSGPFACRHLCSLWLHLVLLACPSPYPLWSPM